MTSKIETPGEAMARIQMEKACRMLAEHIQSLLPPGQGFALFLFEYGEGGPTAYISTADRSDMVKYMKEWIDKQRGIGG